MKAQIQYLQTRLVEVTVEARSNPRLWPVADALKATLAAMIKTHNLLTA